MSIINEFAAIAIRLASPDCIREKWSHGEVKKPETINYRTLKPELEGLFCERIFGSTKDWECYCGKFKSIRYQGVVCDRCQVEVTHSKVRRDRMGHIDLVAPVSHIWYFKGIPSKMGILLGMTLKELDRVLYFQSYIVLDPGDTPLKKKQLLTEEQHQEAASKYGTRFRTGMGAEAVRELLAEIDLPQLKHEINESLKMKQSKQDERQLIRQLDVVQSLIVSENRPEWMILSVLPVLPPELRPMVQLDGGRFATSDLNDLYRRVLNRNNRLRRLVELKAPGIIVRNEKRMLQEAVDALLDNGRRGRPVKGASNNRVLKSLSDMLKGKQGRFRQNLLGKRVDYSGRSVIVIGPELKLNQCGLPKKMALELFKPFIMRVLVQRGLASNIKAAKKMVERAAPEVWEVIEDVIADHPVLLNRAPTLHRLGIQAFQPVLIEGKAIRVHPLVCLAFNADFDGDQMAVHVPLSTEAIVESKMLMSADRNILSPASGKPVITPTQDIVLGIYFMTRERESAANLSRVFSSEEECLYALDTGVIDLHGRIRVRRSRLAAGETRRRIIETTPGRLIFNSVMPDGFEYINKTLGKAQLSVLFNDLYAKYGETITGRTADRVKTIGFDYASRAGISIGVEDMRVPSQKDQLVQISKDDVQKINDQYAKGVITEQERYTKIIDLWTNTTDEVAKVMFDEIEADREGFNPIYIMADSGARGSKAQIKQLAGMRGLMADPLGKIRETPITSNFREGLSVIEFFQSTTGARKGLTDTALKTANAGYLTRRLVDVSQDVVVTEEDCGTPEGIGVSHLKTGEEIVETVGRRAFGRFFAEDVEDPRTEGKILFAAGSYIDEAVVAELTACGIEELKIRSALTCQSQKGVCRKCYGRDLGTGRMVEIGEAVGVIAAQSIGEPGTQLTLRTFHVGGTASADDTYLRARFSGEITALPSGKIQTDGTFLVTAEGDFKGRRIEWIEIVPRTILEYVNSRGSSLTQPLKTGMTVDVVVKNGATVKADEDLVRVEIRLSDTGKVRAIKKDSVIVAVAGKKERRLDIPAGLKVLVAEGEKVAAGAAVARRSFPAPFAGKVVIAARKDGGETMTLTASVEENLSSVSEKGKLVEATAMVGAEPRVKVGDSIELGDIIGMNPSFAPHFAPMDGRVEFERIAIQKEGNEQIAIRPEGIEGDEQGIMVVWKGEEHLIRPNDELEVQHGRLVEPGRLIAKGLKAGCRGVLHIVRRYHTKDGKAVQVVRLVEAGDRRNLPYLRYTRTTAGTAKSKALSKVKKQNIKLISKCHIVRFDLFRENETVTTGLHKLLDDLKAIEHASTFRSDLFTTAEYVVPSQKALMEIHEYEQTALKQRSGLVVSIGELIVKQFSDFLRGPREGGAERAGTQKDITGGLPRVEELFELRKPKSEPACLSPVDGRVILGVKFKKENIAVVKAVDGAEHEIEIPAERHLIVEDGDEVTAGDFLTDGPIDIHELLRVRSETVVQQYIVSEVQDVYRMQGVEINDKHIEVIVRQMMRKVQIDSRGDSEFLPGQLVDRIRLATENRRLEELGKAPASYKSVLLGITKSAKHSDSFISAASFQETTWALTNAAIQGKHDELRGLKEAVIIGHLIPAGTGLKRYRDDVLVEHVASETAEAETKGVPTTPAGSPAG